MKPKDWTPLTFRWLRDPQTDLALGLAQGGPLGDYQHKIHQAVGEPPKFKPIEFFCDPDDVIAVWSPDEVEVAYMPYLVWQREVDEATRSVSHVYSGAGLKPFATGRAPRLDLRVTHRLEGEQVATTIELASRHDSAVDVAYVYQDAAVHWLPDPDQGRVGSIAEFDGETLPDRYVFRPAGEGDFVLTHHRDHAIAGGIAAAGDETWLGVLPAYALFGELVDGPQPPGKLGFAPVAATASAQALVDVLTRQASSSFEPEGRKVRLVLFLARGLPAGGRAVFRFRRFGLTSGLTRNTVDWVERARSAVGESRRSVVAAPRGTSRPSASQRSPITSRRVMRRPPQEGQNPRPLQGKATSRSAPQAPQWTRSRPWAGMPQARNSRSPRSTKRGTRRSRRSWRSRNVSSQEATTA